MTPETITAIIVSILGAIGMTGLYKYAGNRLVAAGRGFTEKLPLPVRRYLLPFVGALTLALATGGEFTDFIPGDMAVGDSAVIGAIATALVRLIKGPAEEEASA